MEDVSANSIRAINKVAKSAQLQMTVASLESEKAGKEQQCKSLTQQVHRIAYFGRGCVTRGKDI